MNLLRVHILMDSRGGRHGQLQQRLDQFNTLFNLQIDVHVYPGAGIQQLTWRAKEFLVNDSQAVYYIIAGITDMVSKEGGFLKTCAKLPVSTECPLLVTSVAAE